LALFQIGLPVFIHFPQAAIGTQAFAADHVFLPTLNQSHRRKFFSNFYRVYLELI
jgi:hypothetical protein